jgi:hypothetical protein
MNRQVRRAVVLLPVLAMAWGAGCSDSVKKATVNGTVTLNDRPLKEGDVRFVPIDGKSQTATAKIVDGKFTVTGVALGEMRVEFSAPKVLKPRKAYDTQDSPMVDEVGELIPERYNVKSELKITVKEGSQDETFALAGR